MKKFMLVVVCVYSSMAAAAAQLESLYKALKVEEHKIFYMAPEIISTKTTGGLSCSASYLQNEAGVRVSGFKYQCTLELTELNFGIIFERLNVPVENETSMSREMDIVKTGEKAAGALRCKRTRIVSHSGDLVNQSFYCSMHVEQGSL